MKTAVSIAFFILFLALAWKGVKKGYVDSKGQRFYREKSPIAYGLVLTLYIAGMFVMFVYLLEAWFS